MGSSRPRPLFSLHHLPANGQDLKDCFENGKKELAFYYGITEMIMAQIRESTEASFKVTYGLSKGGVPLPCDLKIKFQRLDQSTSCLSRSVLIDGKVVIK